MTNPLILGDQLKKNQRRVLKQRYAAQHPRANGFDRTVGIHVPVKNKKNREEVKQAKIASEALRSVLKKHRINKSELATQCLDITRKHC